MSCGGSCSKVPLHEGIRSDAKRRSPSFATVLPDLPKPPPVHLSQQRGNRFQRLGLVQQCPGMGCSRQRCIGYLLGPLNWFERLVAVAAASLLVVAVPLTDEAGIACVALFLVWHVRRNRRAALAAPV